MLRLKYRKFLALTTALGALGVPMAGHAQSDTTVQTTQSTAVAQPIEEDDGLSDEVVGFKPQFGFLSFDSAAGENLSRFMGGLLIEGNLLGDVDDGETVAPAATAGTATTSTTATTSGTTTTTGPSVADSATPATTTTTATTAQSTDQDVGNDRPESRPYLGPSIGVLYSHTGDPGSNFFGLDAPDGEDAGADIVLFPLNLKAGWTFVERVRLSAHGGATVAYLHEGDDESRAFAIEDQADWTVYPNIGGDLELGLGDDVALMLRADWTLREGSELFGGTLGISFPVG